MCWKTEFVERGTKLVTTAYKKGKQKTLKVMSHEGQEKTQQDLWGGFLNLPLMF